MLTSNVLEQGSRLACQSSVIGPVTVEVPAASLMVSHHQILHRIHDVAARDLDPVAYLQGVELPPPRRGDETPDLERLRKVLGPVHVDLDLLREIPGRLREGAYRATAVVADGSLIDLLPATDRRAAYAVAVDLGTTTLAGVLLDLTTGEEVGITSRLNPQSQFGDDVLSRILFVRESPEGLGELHRALAGAVDEMIGELAAGSGIERERIYELTFSGNTTMQQLLCRIDPSSLGEVPFVPSVGRALYVPAAELGLHTHRRGRAYVFPVVGGFVGGDTVAGMLATELMQADGPTLLVDIGTNGEIVLAVDGCLTATSTAAGPAFEGARISHGMRGSTGAIERVSFDGELKLGVIGAAEPTGVCGSALIDLAAGLLRRGILTPQGRLRTPGELFDGVPEDLRRRVIQVNGHGAFVLADESLSGTGRPILITQRDLRELRLASGAIRAGIIMLLKRAGLMPSDLQHIYIAGGFGNFIRRGNAQRMGLLPPELPSERVVFRGNTSLAGARLVALSQTARHQAGELAQITEHVDLSMDPGFHRAFAEAMIFPDGSEE